MNLYIKIFFLAGTFFGIFAGILSMVLGGLEEGLFFGVASGLLYGGVMSLTLGTIQHLCIRKYKAAGVEKADDLHQVRKVRLTLSLERAYDHCIDAVGQIKRGRVVNEDRVEARIDAKAGMTWKSFGERITISLVRVDDNATDVEICSRPSLGTTLVDYGKNIENVRKMESFLKG